MYKYDKLDYYHFGVHLLETEDLDPLYVALAGTDWDAPTMKRWLFTYWLIYHPGSVCDIVTSPDYFRALRAALAGPRGAERRHFRGKKAEDAVDVYEIMGEPEELVDEIADGARSYKEIMARATQLPQFGPWIGFKVADMLERVMRYPISFDDCYLGIYRDPLQGAALIMKGDWKAKMTRQEIIDAYDFLTEVFEDRLAPPHYDRPVNLQEVETIACKYKSHYKGHYPPGFDIEEVHKGLEKAPSNPLRDDLLYQFEKLKTKYEANIIGG